MNQTTKGRRQRIGVIIPSTNTVVETDFWSNAPVGVTIHSSRMYLEETTTDDERRMLNGFLPDAARDIATSRPDVVVFGCTSAGSILGSDGEAELISQIESITQAPVVSTNAAVMTQLQRAGITHPAVFTPYIRELTDSIVRGLEDTGLEAVNASSLGIVDPFEIADVSPAQVISFVKDDPQVDRADGIFISCTNLRALETVNALEEWSELPVVTSNQATIALAMEQLKKPEHVSTRQPSNEKVMR